MPGAPSRLLDIYEPVSLDIKMELRHWRELEFVVESLLAKRLFECDRWYLNDSGLDGFGRRSAIERPCRAKEGSYQTHLSRESPPQRKCAASCVCLFDSHSTWNPDYLQLSHWQLKAAFHPQNTHRPVSRLHWCYWCSPSTQFPAESLGTIGRPAISCRSNHCKNSCQKYSRESGLTRCLTSKGRFGSASPTQLGGCAESVVFVLRKFRALQDRVGSYQSRSSYDPGGIH